MRRVYYHYERWEDWRAGMYRLPTHVPAEVERAHRLLGDATALGEAMTGVCEAWPVAAAQNLTNTEQNRRAWLGQAACCYSVKATESATRLAWWRLGEVQRDRANATADAIIQRWEVEFQGAETLFG